MTPNCYECKHRRDTPGSCHSRCDHPTCNVTAEKHGIVNGWFFFPINFDPVWLRSCDGFEKKETA